MEKLELVYNWLEAGYSVSLIGRTHTNIKKSGNSYCWNNYGSSAIKANKKWLKWLLTEIFDPIDEFYIIDSTGTIRTTNSLIDSEVQKKSTFTLHSRNIWTEKEIPLQQYTMEVSEMLQHYHEIAAQYSREHSKENHVHFSIRSDNIYFRYWNFAI